MTYKRVTAAERLFIYRWLKEGLRPAEIALRLRRSPGSISRELKRNTGLKGYRPKQAQEKAQARAKRLGPRRFTAQVRADVEARLKEGWTPEMIVAEPGKRGGRTCARKRAISTSTPTPRPAVPCGSTCPAPNASGGGVPARKAEAGDESQTKK